MKPANNTTPPNSQMRNGKMQKMMKTLQKEMADTVLEIMNASDKALDMPAIIEAFPDNERRRGCKNIQELKMYVSMGIGKLIQDGKVKELPRTLDGRFPLEVVDKA